MYLIVDTDRKDIAIKTDFPQLSSTNILYISDHIFLLTLITTWIQCFHEPGANTQAVDPLFTDLSVRQLGGQSDFKPVSHAFKH